MSFEDNEEPWELLGVIDPSKTTGSWGSPEEWVLNQNFPAQYHSVMNSIFERAISVIGDDLRVLPSLQFDVEILDTLIIHPRINENPPEFSHAREFAKLPSHDKTKNLDLDWRKYFAYQAFDQLCFCLYMHVYQPIETLDPIIEIDGEIGEIDPVLAAVHGGIATASEFIVLAETWPVIKSMQGHLDREVQRKITQLKKIHGSKGGKNKHAPIAELKEKFYNYYLENTNLSYAESARRFLDKLPQDEDPLLAPTNAVRTLTNFLGRRIKQSNNN